MAGRKSAASPDTMRPTVDRAGDVVAVRVATTGEVSIMADGPEHDAAMPDLDRLLTSDEVALLTGLAPSSWRAYVSRGYAPAADVPELDRPPNRRIPKWRLGTVVEFMRTRRGQGSRTDIHGGAR